MMAVKFAHTLDSEVEIIKGTEIEPRKASLPKKSKRVPKAAEAGSGFETNVPSKPSVAEVVRDDILNMGVDKFKKSDINFIKDYYRRLKGSDKPVPGLSKDKLAKLILLSLGIPQS